MKTKKQKGTRKSRLSSNKCNFGKRLDNVILGGVLLFIIIVFFICGVLVENFDQRAELHSFKENFARYVECRYESEFPDAECITERLTVSCEATEEGHSCDFLDTREFYWGGVSRKQLVEVVD